MPTQNHALRKALMEAQGSTEYQPMLARLVHTIPSTSDWSWEVKWDGFRAALMCDGKRLELRSRNGTDMTPWFTELQGLRELLKIRSGIIDGEIIAGVGDVASFNELLRRARSRGRAHADVAVTFVAFDVLDRDGRDIRIRTIEARREALREIVTPSDKLVCSHVFDDGRALYEQARLGGLEGVVGKKAGSAYTPGRSPLWIKAKVPGVAERHEWHQ